jgi:hypothetical protein
MAGWGTTEALHVNAPNVFVTIYFNSGTRYYSNEFVNKYKGKIINFPQLRASIGAVKRGWERNKITIRFNDSNYEFRGLEDSETIGFKNLAVRIEVGFSLSGAVSSARFFDGTIYDWRRLPGPTFEIDICEKDLNLDRIYPEDRVELSDWPNAHDSAVGWVIPIIFPGIDSGGAYPGACGHPSLSDRTGLPFVDTAPGSEKHLIGSYGIDKSVAASCTPSRVYMNGVLQTFNVDYLYNSLVLPSGTSVEYIYWIGANPPTENDFISCDITADGFEPTASIYTFLLEYCGYVYADVNPTKYSIANFMGTSRGYKMKGMMWEPKPLRDWLDIWREEFEMDLWWDKNGWMCFNYLNASWQTGQRHYRDICDVLDYESNPQISEIVNRIKYGYNFNFSGSHFKNYATKNDVPSQTKYQRVIDTFKGHYFTRDEAMAYDLVARRMIRMKDPVQFEKFKMPLNSYRENLTEVMRVTHFEGPGAAGYVKNPFQVREYNLNVDNFTNDMILENCVNYLGRACRLGDETLLAATWLLADSDDQEYCYLCDETDGQFSNGDSGKLVVD